MVGGRVILLALSIAGSAAAAGAPGFPAGDIFTYPGQPGSEGIADYYKPPNKRPKPRAAGRLPIYRQAEWMIGTWTVKLRDYAYEPPGPGSIIELLTAPATIAFTPDQWWIELDLQFPARSDLWFLGYDAAFERWVLHAIGRPGSAYNAALFAREWTGNRITFEPTELVTAAGVRLVDRITIIRDDPNHFRLVTEAQLPSGKFVAVHDRSFSRAP